MRSALYKKVMMETLLKEGFDALGLVMPENSTKRFGTYYEFLSERAKVMNLTAISGEIDTANLHFLDSAALFSVVDLAGRSVIDVGSGAGFPGIPLKIISPAIDLTLIDSQKKRVDFLEELCSKLEISDVKCLWARAEEAPKHLRESFDVAVSRAVARLRVLCELCIPFVRTGGMFLAMKGSDPSEEIDEAQRAIAALGGKLQSVFEYMIPGTDICHTAVVIEKVSETPDIYPRRYAKIQKSPL